MIRNKLLVAALSGLVAFSCAEMDDTYDHFIKGGEIWYPKKPDSVWVLPGHNRAQVSMLLSSPEIVKFRVFWNDGRDSVEVPVPQIADRDTVSTIIELAEGNYTFEVFTYDRNGNVSIRKDTIGNVYGDVYIESLQNRLVSSAFLIADQPKIEWRVVSKPEIVGGEVQYVDQDGKPQMVRVPVDELVTRIADRPRGDSIRYRTLYLPVFNAIDTFYSAYQTIHLQEPMPQLLNKGAIVHFPLPGDAQSAWDMKGLWNDNHDLRSNTGGFSNAGAAFPKWFSFDLGAIHKLDRFRIWGVHDGREFDAGNVREFELWGSNEPAADGSFDGWTRLGEFEVVKPSGLPDGQLADEDRQAAAEGVEFQLATGTSPARYLRFVVVSTFDTPAGSPSGASWLLEMSFWGYGL